MRILPILALFMSGCALFAFDDPVLIEVPQLEHLGYFPAVDFLGWRFLGRSGDGHWEEMVTDSEASVCILIPRELSYILMAQPLVNHSDLRLRPAGWILAPETITPNEAALTWEQGYAAELLLQLAQKGFPVDDLNIRRFVQRSIDASEGNPWNLDRGRLLGCLKKRDLRETDFRLVAVHDVDFALPSGRWWPDNPLADLLESDGWWSGSLHEGLHRYIHQDGRSFAWVQVQDGQALLMVESPGSTGSDQSRAGTPRDSR